MKKRRSKVPRDIESVMRKLVCAVCAFALAFSMTPAYAIDDATDEVEASSSIDSITEAEIASTECVPQDIQVTDISGIRLSETMSLMYDPGTSLVQPKKDAKEARWYDRIDFPEEYKGFCDNFYRTLVQASNNDGKNDYLIDDEYIQEGSHATNVTNEYRNFADDYGGLLYSGIYIGSISYKTQQEKTDKQTILDDCTDAVMAAFDRDHPEVFWLGNYALTAYFTTYENGVYTGSKYLIIGGLKNLTYRAEKEDMRSISFGSEESIKSAISLREERTKELLAKVNVNYDVPASSTLQANNASQFLIYADDEDNSQQDIDPLSVTTQSVEAAVNSDEGSSDADVPVLEELVEDNIMPDGSLGAVESVAPYTDADKVRFFNKWLTHSNGYNTQDLSDLGSKCPLAFECLSALAGRSGRVGPVCEAYSRAFKVLCDAAGIECVLVDGDAGGAHMWNNVQIDGKWYAVDVTWNDPYVDGNIAKSGKENENYLLVGEDTLYLSGATFGTSHKVENQFYLDGIKLDNGPVLESSEYIWPKTANESNKGDVSYLPTDYPSFDLSFLDRDIGLAIISPLPDAVYNTREITPIPTVTLNGTQLRLGTDYVLSYSNNVQAGKAMVRIHGIGSYAGSNSTPFNIKKASFAVSSVAVKDMVYTGKALKPTPTVTLTNPSFRQNIDYVVETSYSNNKNAGRASASVVVRGIGSCEGAILRIVNFKITPKKMAISRLTSAKRCFIIKWAKAKTAWCTGYQIRYSTNSKFKSGVKTATAKNLSTTKKTVNKLKRKKRYYVAIRAYKTVGGVKYYGAWSAIKSVKTR